MAAFDLDASDGVTYEINPAVVPSAQALGKGKDSVEPVITNVNPPVGPLAGDRATALATAVSFDVTDVNPGFGVVLLTIKYTGRDETILVFNGNSFLDKFDNGDTSRVVITDGFTFTLLPTGGWEDTFELFVYAVDGDGNLEGILPP